LHGKTFGTRGAPYASMGHDPLGYSTDEILCCSPTLSFEPEQSTFPDYIPI